jgi:integrase/recombinase XerD
MVEEGVLESTLLGRRKAPVSRPHQVTPFTPAQVEALIGASRKSSHPKRNEALVLFMVDTGARASEVCGLCNGDLELSSRRAMLTATKGGRTRNVFFGKRSTRALYSLLLESGTKGDPEVPVFLSDRGLEAGGRLTPSGLRQLFERLGNAARIEGVRCSPHTCRHYYAIEFLRAGGSLFSLQQALGHTSLSMVKRYVAWAEADLERQSKQFSPADRLLKR